MRTFRPSTTTRATVPGGRTPSGASTTGAGLGSADGTGSSLGSSEAAGLSDGDSDAIADSEADGLALSDGEVDAVSGERVRNNVSRIPVRTARTMTPTMSQRLRRGAAGAVEPVMGHSLWELDG